MAKPYSLEERIEIDKKIKETTIELLKEKGYKKTTVDEIVKKVGISKGAFYLFYSSKELLIMKILEDFQNEVGNELINEFSQGYVVKERMIEILFNIYIKCKNSFFVKIIQKNEFTQLVNNLDKSRIEEHQSLDDDLIKYIINFIPKKDIDISLYSGVFRAIFLTILHQVEIGDNYDDVLHLMIESIVEKIYEERKDD